MKFIPKCPLCPWESETERGWRTHMSRTHTGYNREQLQAAGIEENVGDRLKFMSGFKSMEDVRAAAPDTEGADAGRAGAGPIAKRPRLSKDEQEKLAMQAEFDRLRPLLVKKWARRLRTPYSLWARLANDPKISLTDEEAEEGAEMHVELMQAMGWMHAGKIEAWADLFMWHGATILGRSDLGAQLLASFTAPQPEEPEKKRPN